MRATKAKGRRPAEAAEELSRAEAVDDAKNDTGVLRRGLLILDAVIKAERPLSSGEISHLVGLSPSTTHRLLRALADQGYVTRDALKRYGPTFRCLFPAGLFHPLNVLRRICFEQLISLRQQFGQASSFVIFLGGKRYVLETVHGREALSPYNENEVSAPLHTSVAGKIFLSTLTEADRDAILGTEPYERYTSSTITDRRTLFSQLDEISGRGYATSLNELLNGLSAVGSPIQVESKKIIGALVLAGPSKNYQSDGLPALVAAVTQVARLLSFASPEIGSLFRSLAH